MADRPSALVLAGGRARRMGGTDKLALSFAGGTVLDRVLAAAAAVSDRVVVVGPPRPTAVPGMSFVREQPPGGGPVPAVQAGLQALPAEAEPEIVLVLAGDLPLLTAPALGRLLDGLAEDPAAAAVAAAHGDRPNPLLAAYRSAALRRTAGRLGPGAAAAGLLPQAVRLVDLGPEATLNVNAPEDLRRAAMLAAARARG